MPFTCKDYESRKSSRQVAKGSSRDVSALTLSLNEELSNNNKTVSRRDYPDHPKIPSGSAPHQLMLHCNPALLSAV
jgi:hypothetical protein